MRGIRLVLGLLCLSLGTPVWAHESKEAYQRILGSLLDKVCESQLSGSALEEARRKWQGKVVIFDTNVLLNDPYAVFKYPGAQIIIPGTVIEEIDSKKEDVQTGKAAREFGRIVDGFLQAGGNLRKGVELGDGATLKVDNRDLTHYLEETTFDRGKKDNEIVALALAYTYAVEGHGNVVLVTDDRNVRIKASSEEVLSIPFEYDWVTSATKIEREFSILEVSDEDFTRFKELGKLPRPEDFKIRPNEFVMIVKAGMDQQNLSETCPECLARYFYDREEPAQSHLRKVPTFAEIAAPPKNLEQRMLLDLELDPTIHLVIVEADAGTGKTFMTVEAAFMQTGNNNGSNAHGKYEEVTITKPMVHMGRGSLGTLPGDSTGKLKEKLNSFYDNVKALKKKMAEKGKNGKGGGGGGLPNLEIAPFPEVRGRSFHNTFFVIDEFQNTSVHEAKTILTRAATGTKIVILGNVAQIDDPYLNDRNNGLSVTATLFTGEDLTDEERSLVGFVKLKEGVRSDISTLSIKLFAKPLPNH